MEIKKIPLTACYLTAAEINLGDNGENAKTAPFKMLARTGDPIPYPYFGNLVNDMAGMKLSRNRVSIDYEHNEIIGYANKFDISTGDLVVGGVIESAIPNDRGQEVITRGKNGQPYEASIGFFPELIEEIDLGESVNVNNRTINGPACIVREWQLRSIAVCKSGADPHTITALKAGGEVECKIIKKGQIQMTENEKVETVETVVETLSENKIENEKVEAVELAAVETETPETKDEVATDSVAAPVETVEQVETVVETEEQKVETVDEAVVEAPVELTAPVVAKVELSAQVELMNSEILELKNENEELKSRLTALSNVGEKQPVAFSVAPDTDKNQYNIEKRNQLVKMGIDPAKASMAAGIKLPK